MNTKSLAPADQIRAFGTRIVSRFTVGKQQGSVKIISEIKLRPALTWNKHVIISSLHMCCHLSGINMSSSVEYYMISSFRYIHDTVTSEYTCHRQFSMSIYTLSSVQYTSVSAIISSVCAYYHQFSMYLLSSIQYVHTIINSVCTYYHQISLYIQLSVQYIPH
jgi:hypothetical protein